MIITPTIHGFSRLVLAVFVGYMYTTMERPGTRDPDLDPARPSKVGAASYPPSNLPLDLDQVDHSGIYHSLFSPFAFGLHPHPCMMAMVVKEDRAKRNVSSPAEACVYFRNPHSRSDGTDLSLEFAMIAPVPRLMELKRKSKRMTRRSHSGGN